MMKMNKKVISLAACALVLSAGLSVKPAMAYFTASASASGKIPIAIEDTHSSITESGEGQVKVISVSNTQTTSCYVRVAVLMPESISAAFSGKGWSYNESDEYYYYADILQAGESADELTLTIDTSNALSDANFHVIVVPESAKVLYDADGNPYARWNETEGGEQE